MFHFRSSTSSVIRCGVGKFGGWAAAGGGGERQLASRKTNHNFSSLAMSRMMVASGSHGSLTIRKRPIYNSKIQYAHPKKADYLAPSAHLLLGGQHLQTGQHLSLLQNQLGAVSHFSSQIPPPRRGGNRVAQGAGLLGAASLLFGKTKYVLAALKLTKLASLGSMIVSIGAYSMFFGLPYACGIVGLITVHEAGTYCHLVAAGHGSSAHHSQFSSLLSLVLVSRIVFHQDTPMSCICVVFHLLQWCFCPLVSKEKKR